MVPFRTNGIVPPTDIKTRANILVATAVRGSMPTWNIAGTAMSELLPVTTPTMLVRKNTTISMTRALNGHYAAPGPFLHVRCRAWFRAGEDLRSAPASRFCW